MFDLLGLHMGTECTLDDFLEMTVNIGLRFVGLFDDFVAAFLFGGRGGKNVDFIGTFGTPGDVVPVAEGVDVEDVDVGGGEGEIGPEGVEHVPRVEVGEGSDEVETVGGDQGKDDQLSRLSAFRMNTQLSKRTYTSV